MLSESEENLKKLGQYSLAPSYSSRSGDAAFPNGKVVHAFIGLSHTSCLLLSVFSTEGFTSMYVLRSGLASTYYVYPTTTQRTPARTLYVVSVRSMLMVHSMATNNGILSFFSRYARC